MDLWGYITNKVFTTSAKNDNLFKMKSPKKLYLQVKGSLIKNGTETIVFMNDFTMIKQLQKNSDKVRSMFFSSVAHELRTPLNSIIPITKMLIDMISDPKASKFLNIINNASMHLQNVIEDALDLSRIENNKFEVNLSFFDIRNSVE